MNHADAAALLGRGYAGITEVVTGLDDEAFLAPTGCRGWAVADLLFHVLLDAQRALVAIATPSGRGPDTDAVTYWTGHDDAATPSEHAWFVRRSAAAYRSPRSLVAQWSETSAAAARALAACPDVPLLTQERSLTPADLAATMVVEACVHHLDLVVSLPGAATPVPAALDVVADTLDGLAALRAGRFVDLADAAGWDARTYVLKGFNRIPVTPDESRRLGALAGLVPLLG